MEITPDFIDMVTSLPVGLPWSKEEKPLGQVAKKTFFQPNEHLVEDKNGINRTSIPYPWDEFSYQIIKYISYEGRYSIVYGYHFRLPHELRYGMDISKPQKLSIPYFLLQSLIDASIKLKAGSPYQLAHHGLIKLLVEEALHTFTIPITWEIFRNMIGEYDIKALTYDLSPYESEREEQKGEDEEETKTEYEKEKPKIEEETKIEDEKEEPEIEKKKTREEKKEPRTEEKKTKTEEEKTRAEKKEPRIEEEQAKIERKNTKPEKKKTKAEKVETKKDEKETKIELEETKLAEAEKIKEEEKGKRR